MVYESAAKALIALVSEKEKGAAKGPWRLKMTEAPLPMRNGIDYFFVEVTFANGEQYGIPAYGEEAYELRGQAELLKGAGERPLILPITV